MMRPKPFYLKWFDAFHHDDDYVTSGDMEAMVLEDVGWYLGRRMRGKFEYVDYCTEYAPTCEEAPHRFCHSVPVANVIEMVFLKRYGKTFK